jgi:probable rRNA maturation factor|tara:strand:- start:283 stop:747 length:465 start_codon:yes stop_codon:yes gene_type:complete
MINFTISSITNKWTKRIRKIDEIVTQILVYKKDLRFIKNINYHCDFILANDRFIKGLNKKFRKVNQPTDVLTFVSKLSMKNKKEDRHCDVVFSIETILNDAKKNNVNFYNHLTHLIIHSFLHINDFLHSNIKDYLIMKKTEVNILKKLGIANPY